MNSHGSHTYALFHQKRWCVWVLCLANAFIFPVHADQIHPLSTINTRPIVLIHGLPASRSAIITPPSSWQFELDYGVTNHYTHNYDSNEQVRFDGETTRTAVSIKRGIDSQAELEVVIPYISHDGGSLDKFIEDWHDTFGFPQNGRTSHPRNQLHFFYEKNGVTKLDFTSPASGVGDVQVIFAIDWRSDQSEPEKNRAFKAAIKLPTGDSDRLTGSGGLSVSAWLTGESPTRWFDFRGRHYFSFGAMLMEEGDVISDQQQSAVLFGGIGSGVQLSQRIVLQLQLDSHTPFYKGSDLTEINSVAFLLTMGGNLKLTESWNLDIAVVEDVLPHAAPDVTFHLGLNSRW